MRGKVWYNEATKRHENEETMLRIAICDDTLAHAEQLVKAFRTFGEEHSVEIETTCYAGLAELERALNKDVDAYRLLVLETRVDGVDGVAFACGLRAKGCTAEILFFTGDASRALDAYAAYPMGYILKPAQRNELRDAFRFVAGRYEKKPTIILNGMGGKRSGFVADDIIYIEVFRTELEVHSAKGSATCVGALGEVYERLPKDQFYRSHRSFIVNLKRIRKMEKYRFIMDNGDFVTIAKNRYAEAKKAWKAFCEGAPTGVPTQI